MSSQGTTTISPAQLQQAVKEGLNPRVLDVRTGGEYAAVHIPGSHNVPLDQIGGHLDELAGGDQPIVLVCQSGARAGNACQQLLSAGGSSLAVLEGGIQSWQSAGGDVVVGKGKWAMDRQVRFVAGILVMAGILLSLVVPGAQWFSAAVGFGLFFSAASNTCAMGALLAKLPYNRSAEVSPADVQRSVAALVG